VERLQKAPQFKPNRPEPFLIAGDPRFERMLKLVLVEESDLEAALIEWPEYQEMGLIGKKVLERRIQSFRERTRKEALRFARESGIQIEEGQETAFIQDYWMERSRVEKEVRAEAEQLLRKKADDVRRKMIKRWGPEGE